MGVEEAVINVVNTSVHKLQEVKQSKTFKMLSRGNIFMFVIHQERVQVL